MKLFCISKNAVRLGLVRRMIASNVHRVGNNALLFPLFVYRQPKMQMHHVLLCLQLSSCLSAKPVPRNRDFLQGISAVFAVGQRRLMLRCVKA